MNRKERTEQKMQELFHSHAAEMCIRDRVEYDRDDREIDIEFSALVQYENPTVQVIAADEMCIRDSRWSGPSSRPCGSCPRRRPPARALPCRKR